MWRANSGLEVKRVAPDLGNQIRAFRDPLSKAMLTARSTGTLNLWIYWIFFWMYELVVCSWVRVLQVLTPGKTESKLRRHVCTVHDSIGSNAYGKSGVYEEGKKQFNELERRRMIDMREAGIRFGKSQHARGIVPQQWRVYGTDGRREPDKLTPQQRDTQYDVLMRRQTPHLYGNSSHWHSVGARL